VPTEGLAILGDLAPRAGYLAPSAGPTVAVSLGDLVPLKLAAIERHVSQTGSDGPFAGWDPAVRDNWLSAEHYRLAVSNLAASTPPAGVGSDLFDGLA